MRPWREGDPVGMGPVYLPTKAVSAAYTAACLHEMAQATARAIAKEPSLAKRREMMARATQGQNEQFATWLRNRVAEIWQQNKERNQK